MEDVYSSLKEITECITNSKEYQDCISIKEKMENNQELMAMIEEIKKLQKRYVNTNYSKTIKKELDELEKRMNSIPIYVIYLQKLEIVNEKIEYIKDSLNDYFNSLMN